MKATYELEKIWKEEFVTFVFNDWRKGTATLGRNSRYWSRDWKHFPNSNQKRHYLRQIARCNKCNVIVQHSAVQLIARLLNSNSYKYKGVHYKYWIKCVLWEKLLKKNVTQHRYKLANNPGMEGGKGRQINHEYWELSFTKQWKVVFNFPLSLHNLNNRW
jgi:hypothetical protein